jgi:hypothetical protein
MAELFIPRLSLYSVQYRHYRHQYVVTLALREVLFYRIHRFGLDWFATGQATFA